MTTLVRTRVLDEAAARRDLRAQIARLEAQLQQRAPGIGSGGPRLPGLAELSATRDALVHAIAREQAARRAEADGIEHHRRLLEAALADPPAHRWLRIPLAALGEPGCGAYEVRPRVGLLGMLAGWWEVKLSSGCP
ncbi:MAG: hypothetical protein QOI80_2360 [Solirubrobacteraceae bacterium]|jgi:hypothetical protein|nr:hypothetical protein [Solirubrobacteraceae bacterium]